MSQTGTLNNFLKAVITDGRIGPTHISLFAGLLKLWYEQNYRNPFVISRRILMPICKINGVATYHEKLKDLHNFGYVQYEPTFNSYEGSLVTLKDFLLT